MRPDHLAGPGAASGMRSSMRGQGAQPRSSPSTSCLVRRKPPPAGCSVPGSEAGPMRGTACIIGSWPGVGAGALADQGGVRVVVVVLGAPPPAPATPHTSALRLASLPPYRRRRPGKKGNSATLTRAQGLFSPPTHPPARLPPALTVATPQRPVARQWQPHSPGRKSSARRRPAGVQHPDVTHRRPPRTAPPADHTPQPHPVAAPPLPRGGLAS